jgi:hypothetical protein
MIICRRLGLDLSRHDRICCCIDELPLSGIKDHLALPNSSAKFVEWSFVRQNGLESDPRFPTIIHRFALVLSAKDFVALGGSCDFRYGNDPQRLLNTSPQPFSLIALAGRFCLKD